MTAAIPPLPTPGSGRCQGRSASLSLSSGERAAEALGGACAHHQFGNCGPLVRGRRANAHAEPAEARFAGRGGDGAAQTSGAMPPFDPGLPPEHDRDTGRVGPDFGPDRG